jgi:hypothetical protein
MHPEIEILAPGNLSSDEFQTCLALLEQGNAVDVEYARKELPRAVCIALRRDAGEIVALGAVKRIRPNYAADKADRAGFQFDSNIHEVGYIVVRESHRDKKLSRPILEALLASFDSRPLFATTFNERMMTSLGRCGFEKKGKKWQNPKGDWLSLWIMTTLAKSVDASQPTPAA